LRANVNDRPLSGRYSVTETHRIVIQLEAFAGMESGYAYIEQDPPENARQWAIGRMAAIKSLATFPTRCPIINISLNHDVAEACRL
jgi:hypothetical protein